MKDNASQNNSAVKYDKTKTLCVHNFYVIIFKVFFGGFDHVKMSEIH